MTCTSPVLIRNPKPTFGLSTSFGLWVPCGHCVSCRIAHAREWATRMMHELEYYEDSSFITLTYDDDHLPEDNSLSKRELQLFFKRFRKLLDHKIKYYACGEYGEDEGRAHYHAVIFGYGGIRNLYWNPKLKSRKSHTNGAWSSRLIDKAWPFGFNVVGSVSYDSCRYVADYVGKKYNGDFAKSVYGERQVPFQLQSGGIGRRFALDHADQLEANLGCTIHGAEVGLPRYYRKVLKIDTATMAVKALEHEEALAEHYGAKGYVGEAEISRPLYEARQQADVNVKARQALFKRDNF